MVQADVGMLWLWLCQHVLGWALSLSQAQKHSLANRDLPSPPLEAALCLLMQQNLLGLRRADKLWSEEKLLEMPSAHSSHDLQNNLLKNKPSREQLPRDCRRNWTPYFSDKNPWTAAHISTAIQAPVAAARPAQASGPLLLLPS